MSRLTERIQAALALLVVGSVIVFYAYWRWVPEGLTTMAATAFGYYFGKRQQDHADKLEGTKRDG